MLFFCANSPTLFSISFTYSINKSFGIYLESVNGLAGSTENILGASVEER